MTTLSHRCNYRRLAALLAFLSLVSIAVFVMLAAGCEGQPGKTGDAIARMVGGRGHATEELKRSTDLGVQASAANLALADELLRQDAETHNLPWLSDFHAHSTIALASAHNSQNDVGLPANSIPLAGAAPPALIPPAPTAPDLFGVLQELMTLGANYYPPLAGVVAALGIIGTWRNGRKATNATAATAGIVGAIDDVTDNLPPELTRALFDGLSATMKPATKASVHATRAGIAAKKAKAAKAVEA